MEKLMIIINATMQAAAGKEKELETVLLELVKGTATEEGAMEYRLHRFIDTPGKFRFCEKFKDQEAFDFHCQTDHFVNLGAKIGPLLEGEGVLEKLELVDSIPE